MQGPFLFYNTNKFVKFYLCARGKACMFLPLFITERGLELVVYQTWDKPCRYFDTREEHALLPLVKFFNLNNLPLKKVDDLSILESKRISVSYCLHKTTAEKLSGIIDSIDQCRVLTFSSTDSLYEQSLPEELILGILRVVSKEL